MTEIIENSQGENIMDDTNSKQETTYANLTDDTGELDYEPSEPDNSIKDVVSEDEQQSYRSSSTPRSIVSEKRQTNQDDNDLEEGEVDELEDGEVKEDDGEDSQDAHDQKGNGHQSLPKPKPVSADPQNVKRVSEVLHTSDVRPEDVGICKFYIRGQCTWGNFCKFLHPGVNERGAYQMQYDSHPTKLMNKPVPAPAVAVPSKPQPIGRLPPPSPQSQPVVKAAPVPAESAWERGLKQAREMMKKANEKKETDADFEEKRNNMPMDTVGNEVADEPEPVPGRLDRQAPVRSSDSSNYGRYTDGEQTSPTRRDPVPLMQESVSEEFGMHAGQRDHKVNYYSNARDPQQFRMGDRRQQPMHQGQHNRYFNQNKYTNNGASRPPMRDARERIDSQKERDFGYERRGKFDSAPQEKGRPLPYERPSYEGKEWRDPWMRSSKPKGFVGNDYTSGGGDRVDKGSKSHRRRSFSGSSSSTRSSKSSKSSISHSSASSSSATRSLSSIKSSSSGDSKGKKGKRTLGKRSSKNDKDFSEDKSLPKPYTHVPSVSPISSDSESHAEELMDQKVSVDSDPIVKSPPRKEAAQRKPIKMTIMNKSKVQVPLAYEDELSNAHKLEPLSPGNSSTSIDSTSLKRKAPPDFEDISPQESDNDDDESIVQAASAAVKTPSSTSTDKEDPKTVTSRREELLKQLKAVEDAIANKRKKPN